ncbi:hypothetical protein C8Q79DRAFT_1012629 [Trametes meyenii]|nr:hypothetical protein C8Q79DRAFT_1012629 [Trametes meyenii]
MANPVKVLFNENRGRPFYGLPPVDMVARRVTTCQPRAGTGTVAEQLDRFELELLSHRALWNAGVPINQLPQEILLEVFKYFLPNSQSLNHRFSHRTWAHLMRVCRHWCALIRSCPTFWSDTFTNGSMRWFNLALPRARQAPLGLLCLWDTPFVRVLPLLESQAYRVVHLLLNATLDNQHVLDRLLYAHFPVLVELHMTGSYDVGAPQAYFPAIDTRIDRFPRLQRLYLSELRLFWTSPLVSGLRELSLSNCSLLTPSFALNAFLDVLEQAQRLEKLIFLNFLPSALQPESTGEPGRVVRLPSLHRIDLWEDTVTINQLMTHLQFPTVGSVRLLSQQEDDVYSPPPLYSLLLPPDLDSVPCLRTATRAKLDIWGPDHAFSCANDVMKIDLAFEPKEHGETAVWEPWFTAGFVQLQTLVGTAPLTTLWLCGHLSKVTRAAWDTLFDRFPLLENLTLTVRSGDATEEELLFPDDPVMSLGTPSAYPATIGSSVRCPRLRRLKIEGGPGWYYLGGLVVLAACLRTRATCLAPKLERLWLSPDAYGTSSEMAQGYFRLMEGLAEIFEGWPYENRHAGVAPEGTRPATEFDDWDITGCSSGFGRETVIQLLDTGEKVVATLRKPEALDDLVKKYLADRLLVVKLDVTSPADIKVAFSQAKAAFGRIDVVFNNAGYFVIGEAEAIPDDVARPLFEVNFWGAVHVSQEAVRFFRDENEPRGGFLLQNSSADGLVGIPSVTGAYAATKHALEGWSEALSKEVDPAWNIKVTIIEPGSFKTSVLDKNMIVVPQHPAYADPELPVRKFRRIFLKGAG